MKAVIIHVYAVELGDTSPFFNIVASDDEGNEFGDSQENDHSMLAALDDAEAWAELIVARAWADRVVILEEGNEHSVVDGLALRYAAGSLCTFHVDPTAVTAASPPALERSR